MKPTRSSRMPRATIAAGIPSLIPRCSSASALPLALETPRLPCFATWPPAAATTKAEALEMLNRLAPSPPVPTISTSGSTSTSTGIASSRMTSAAAVISSIDSPFMRRPVSNAPICASVQPPVITARMTSRIASRSRSM